MQDTLCIDCCSLSDSWHAVSFRKQKKVLALTVILICKLIVYRINFGLWNSNVNKKKSWIHQKSKTGRSLVYIDLNIPANQYINFIINIIWVPDAIDDIRCTGHRTDPASVFANNWGHVWSPGILILLMFQMGIEHWWFIGAAINISYS